jgi:hypothetical protein
VTSPAQESLREEAHNEAQVEARRQFTTAKARIILHRLYP